jgi:hypothetical protein
VPVKQALAIALAMVIAAPALANPPKSTDKSHKGSGDDDDDDDDDTAAKPKPAAKGSAQSGDDDDDDDDDDTAAKAKTAKPAATTTQPAEEMQKQDLTGHDMGTNKKTTAEEKDRFFVDKVDSKKTEKGTLVQGSLTLSTFLYAEGGGAYGLPTGAAAYNGGNDTTAPAVYWGDLRLQTDFRHIGGGRWDGRVDFRARFVNTPTNDVDGQSGTGTFVGTPPISTQPNLVQSGLLGGNEYDLRELWLIRNGVSTDVIFGRQFIPDLGAVKIDGVRVDYASSPKFTYLGFAGLYPLRGSRSLSTDYGDSYDPTTGANLGRIFTGAGGFGGAYRTQQAYGSVGGVALVPFSNETARVFATSQGYWRINPKLDFYHFALIDIVSSYGAQLTNLSAGINYKPTARLRLTASFNRTDTDTLNIQAANFFTNNGIGATPTGGAATPASPGYVLNEIYVSRIATNEGRASISAGLGNNERFELTGAATLRERPDFNLNPTVAMGMAAGPAVAIKAGESLELYGSFTDRHSFKDMRLGIDGLNTFAVGDSPYDRVTITSIRVFAARELESGKGEWEAEASYSGASDQGSSTVATCPSPDPGTSFATCYGASKNSVLSIGPTFYYRLSRDWFVLAMVYLQRTSIEYYGGAAKVSDAPIDGFTGYGRIAYRF